jgi:general secretion pathway protein K
MSNGATRQRGMAILLAMLVVALATIAASGFVFHASLEWRKYENAASLSQARWVLRAAEHWAAAVLRDDARQGNVDHLGEIWARPLPPVEAEGYALTGQVEDQDGRFNINNIVANGAVDVAQLAILRRLLVGLDLPEDLAADIADWLDADSEALQGGRDERLEYLTRQPAVVPANRPLASFGELARVRGVDARVMARLAPYVAVLPERNRINVNTAPAEVIAALVPGLSLDQAYTLAARRERAYFRDQADFSQALPAGLSAEADMVATASRFFLVRARARHERVDIAGRALLRRDGGALPVFVWRATL